MKYCHVCAEPGKSIDIAAGESVVVSGSLCDPCFDQAMVEFRELQREFASLIEAGVSNEMANQIMIAKLDSKQARS